MTIVKTDPSDKALLHRSPQITSNSLISPPPSTLSLDQATASGHPATQYKGQNSHGHSSRLHSDAVEGEGSGARCERDKFDVPTLGV
jgi:hypothetical protein